MPFIISILAVVSAVLLGHLATTGAPLFLVLGCIAIIVSVFAFLNPKASLLLLVFSMLLSPKLGMGAASESRTIVLRYDDILLFIIFFSWFAKTAIFKEKPFILSTPVQTPVLLYTTVYIISSGLGVMRGDIDFKAAAFYLLKYLEYFLLYFMTVNIVETKAEIRKYLAYGAGVAVIVTLYAFYYYSSATVDPRTTAPFETPLNSTLHTSEPASLGGYYLVIFGVLLGMLTEYSGRLFLLLAGLLAFMLPAFLLTFSRSSYIGFVAMALTLIAVTRQRKFMLSFILVGGLVVISLVPGIFGKVRDRIMMTYQGDYAVNTVDLGVAGQVKLEDSAAARLGSMKSVIFDKLPQHPIFGLGVTGIGLGDTQYALVLGEVGLSGLALFVWMIYTIFTTARKVYGAYEVPWIRALSLGLMASTVGLLFQAVGVNTFIIIRIMEPFWFITALVMVLYRDLPMNGKTGAGSADARA